MNLKLYIENEEVELTESVAFTITKAFEDLSSPTDILNDWSKSVEIPFSNRNNSLFGGIFSPNRAVAYNDGTHDNIGIYFDASRKLDFKLLWNGALLMNGYCKMQSIKRKDGNGVYEIVLYGVLGKIFSELKKLKCYSDDELSSDATLQPYDLTNIISGTINKSAVYNSWTREREDSDVIGFACCNDGYNDDFDSSSVQISFDSNKQFEEILKDRYGDGTHNVTIDPSTLVGDGILPRSFGEYRSYYQRPYIYLPKMFQILNDKMNDIPSIDYKLFLHPKWFNQENHYYWDEVMLLNRISDIDTKDVYNNKYRITDSALYKYYGTSGGYTQMVQKQMTFSIIEEESPLLNNNKFNTSEGFVGGTVNLPMYLRLSGGGWTSNFHFSDKNALVIQIMVYGSNQASKTYTYIILRSDYDTDYINVNGYDGIIYISKDGTLVGDDYYWYFTLPLQIWASDGYFGDNISIYQTALWYNNESPAIHIATPFDASYMYVGYTSTPTIKMTLHKVWNRSWARYNFRNLWDNEQLFFDVLLKYCKLYRLLFIVDEENKLLKVVPSDEYFKDYTVVNYDDGINFEEQFRSKQTIDMSQDFVITPCTMDSKYLSLGYSESETALGGEYLNKYGVEFGDRKFYTYYDFNNETTNLLSDIPTSITNTSVGVDWDNLYAAKSNSEIVYYQNYETRPHLADNDNKSVEGFGQFYFYRGLKEFDTKLRDAYITDDTTFQITNNEYMYIDSRGGERDNVMVKVTTYPWLDIVDADGHMILFNRPSVSYDINNDYSDTTSIYDNFWVNYLNERYNLQNNKVQCQIWLKPNEYLNFDYNHFIYFANRMYMINKIEDYNITSQQTTKCELISIYDDTAYTDVPYDYPTNYVALSELSHTINGGGTFTITGYSTDNTLTLASSPTLLYTVSILNRSNGIFDITFNVRTTLQNSSVNVNFQNGSGKQAQIYLNIIGAQPVPPLGI